MRRMGFLAVCISVLALLASPGFSDAGDKGHGAMAGMKVEGKMEGHGMMKMGDKIFEGNVGNWQGEARLVDMKAQMEKAKMSAKMMETMTNTHHLSLLLTDPKTGKPVTEGKGTVTVTAPGGKEKAYDLMAMQGHFGADVALKEPGKYGFSVEIDSGGKKGDASFHHTVQ